MYYVKLEMSLYDGTEAILGTPVTEDADKALSQLLAYRDCAESLSVAEVIKGYNLFLGTCPSSGKSC